MDNAAVKPKVGTVECSFVESDMIGLGREQRALFLKNALHD